MVRKCIVLAIVAVLGLAAVPRLGHAEEVRLTYSSFFPPTHVQSQLAEAWCKEVEKRTNGEVVVDFFPGGTLSKAPQCYDGVVEGISDIGQSALAYSRGRFPVMAAVDLPLGYRSGLSATNVANAVYAKFQPAELDDVSVMYFHAHGPGLLHTRKVAVRKLEDMKGLKIRATGNSAKVVEALGGTPVAQSMPDAYQSIRKGVVDGGMYPVETNKGWKMGEVVDYMTESFPAGYTTTFFVVMNKAKWNALTDAQRKIISEINAEWAVKHGQAWDASDVEGREFFLSLGHQIIPLDDAESARWKAAVAPINEAYKAELNDKGLNGAEIVDFTAAELEKTGN